MKGTNSQKGQALILIAFGIVALIGFTALAVDGGRVFSDRRNAQNAADTSALAAALKYIREVPINPGTAKDSAKAEAENRAFSNDYETDADHTVIVEFCDEVPVSDPPCNLPGVESTEYGEYIRVRIISNVPMTFARVLGREFVTNRVEAITRVQDSSSTENPTAGAGMYSTKSTGDDCFTVLGSANLVFHDTGIFVNCDGDDALTISGSAYIYMDANAQVVGCSDEADDVPPAIDGTGEIDCNVPPQTVTEDTYKDVPTADSAPPCPANVGSYDSTNNILGPGTHPTRSLSKDTTLMPGLYCFPSGSELKLIAGASISGTGLVQMVMFEDISLKGSANNFENLELFMTNSDFGIAAQGVLTANRMRFFGIGNSSFEVDAQGELTSGDIYIYSEAGMIDIQAGADVDITAPPQGDTYGGLLMYMPWDNPNDFMLNGGSDNIWRGTILMPTAHVTYNGSAGFELYGQVIAETFDINGDAGGDIYFASDYTYSPPDDPTIEFTK